MEMEHFGSLWIDVANEFRGPVTRASVYSHLPSLPKHAPKIGRGSLLDRDGYTK